MTPTRPPSREKGTWRRFLRDEEAAELARLETLATEIDSQRRNLTRAMNLIRNRVMVREAYATQKDLQEDAASPSGSPNLSLDA